ncbi:MAG: hypothetical protein A2Y81_12760 [Nitrospirae bacterium RBG_13_43_8]|nr:MAG: hypothetical protein A2Y81_12760 [Nitrospirae bacterium RBG_13_43_8]
MIDLSINICSFNSIEDLRLCLISIYQKIKGIRFETIVVDNASTDGTADIVKRDFPEVILIENKTNKGVAAARNQAIKQSKGRYILLLDADTEIVSEEFDDLIKYMDSSPETGLLGVKQMTADNKLYPAARTFPRPRHIVMGRLAFLSFIRESSTLKGYHLSYLAQDRPATVHYVIGAFQLIRREMFNMVGLLDSNMFYGFEDADYCARIRRAGYKVVYYPLFTIKHHVQGRTRGKNLFSKKGFFLLFHHFLSYSRFYKKHRDLLKGELL